jgi:hypothetical protein
MMASERVEEGQEEGSEDQEDLQGGIGDIFAETSRRDDTENCVMLINQEQEETRVGWL